MALLHSPSILVVEDDPNLLEAIKQLLESACFTVESAPNGQVALEKIASQSFGLILIDMGLPDIFGIELLDQIKKLSPSIPCIFLSGHQLERDIVRALELGAEDYILKPFKAGELLARIRKVLQRSSPGKPIPQAVSHLSFAGLCLKSERKEAYLYGQNLSLTHREFDILFFLASHPQEVISREEILNQVWPTEEDITDRIVDAHIYHIRKKLKLKQSNADQYIQTHRGLGYSFHPPSHD